MVFKIRSIMNYLILNKRFNNWLFKSALLKRIITVNILPELFFFYTQVQKVKIRYVQPFATTNSQLSPQRILLEINTKY